jgi:hypothetical protein
MKLTRAEIQERHIPASYRWQVHVGALLGSAVAVGGVSLARIETPDPWDWVVFVLSLALANGGEYWLHRIPFHHRVAGPAGGLYERHTVMHHAMFDHGTMACDSPRDLRWVLLPPWGFAGVTLVMAPLAWALSAWRQNFGWMLMLALAAYYVVYELLHTAAHLPGAVGRHPFILRVTRHHRIHHDPRVMRRSNFNFALPLFDWLHGTALGQAAPRDGHDPARIEK